MKLRVEGAMTGPFGCRQRFVEDRKRASHRLSALRLRERNLEESVEGQDVLLAQQFDPATHVRDASLGPAFSRRHAHENEPERLPHRQIMLSRDSREFGGV